MSPRLTWLPDDPAIPVSAAPFPPVSAALHDPNGLLAVGGDLRPDRLLEAYRHGIFPWYSEGEPILWWSPDPRTVFRSDGVRLSRRDRRSLRASGWIVRADTAFDAVLSACAGTPRPGQDGTWITEAMAVAYRRLHRLGHAHSIEVFDPADPDAPQLVGGIYGVAIGRMFFGESMVSLRTGGSKAALAALARLLHDRDWPLIDAQVENPHLLRMGAESWPRRRFVAEVATLVDAPGRVGPWTDEVGERPLAALIP
jgi:leucyl/phenylalanyl-tRNA--protein transferase